jgi:predicted nucleic acid-binding protein
VIVLDASVVIAMFNPNDPHHNRAIDVIDENAGDALVIHPMTLAEVLVGAVQQGHASRRLAEIDSIGIRRSEPHVDEPLLLAELRATTGLRLPDCCVLAVATQKSGTLVTFDGALKRAALGLNVRVLPDP